MASMSRGYTTIGFKSGLLVRVPITTLLQKGYSGNEMSAFG